MLERKQETKRVKEILKYNKIPYISIKHGIGTAYCWLTIILKDERQNNKESNWEKEKEILRIIQNATERRGDYDGRINIHWR